MKNIFKFPKIPTVPKIPNLPHVPIHPQENFAPRAALRACPLCVSPCPRPCKIIHG